MTYDQAVQWCVDNVPMTQYDSFEEWYNHCVDKELMGGGVLRGYEEFNQGMRDAWENTIGDINKSREEIEEQEIQERQEAIEQTDIRQYDNIPEFKINKEPEIPEVIALRYPRGLRIGEFTSYTDLPPVSNFEEPTLPLEYSYETRQEIKTPELPREPQRQEPPRKKSLISRLGRFLRGLFK